MDILTQLVDKIDLSSLPDVVVWLVFLYFVVVRDLDRRLTGLSGYIKKFLVIQRGRQKSSEALAEGISRLVEVLSPANEGKKEE